MAYQDYRPDYEYLWSLGFVETDSGESHPFDRWNELKLSDNVILHMDCFWDFKLEIVDSIEDTIPVQIGCNGQLEQFINLFKSLTANDLKVER